MAICIVLNKTDVDFYGFAFVSKALGNSKTEKRPHIINIFIDDGRAVATDGRRLHCYDYHGKYSQGFYRVEAKTRAKIVLVKTQHKHEAHRHFPEYKNLLTEKGTQVVSNRANENCFYKDVYTNMAGDVTIRIEFLKDLPPESYELTFTGTKERSEFIIFSYDRISGVIMPMTI